MSLAFFNQDAKIYRITCKSTWRTFTQIWLYFKCIVCVFNQYFIMSRVNSYKMMGHCINFASILMRKDFLPFFFQSRLIILIILLLICLSICNYMNFYFFTYLLLLVQNHWSNLNQTWHKDLWDNDHPFSSWWCINDFIMKLPKFVCFTEPKCWFIIALLKPAFW